MIKILKIEFKTLFCKFWTWVIIVLIAAMALENALTSKIYEQVPFENFSILMIPIFISVWPGFYISNDYTQNTIRNKIIVGNTRLNIYFSKLITVTLFFLICIATYVLSAFISNIIINNATINSTSAIIYLTIVFFETIAISSITTFIAISIKREVGGLVPLLFMFGTLILLFSLYEIVKPETMKFINQIIPLGTLLSLEDLDLTAKIVINSKIITDVIVTICYSIVITISTTLIGCISFKKADLK